MSTLPPDTAVMVVLEFARRQPQRRHRARTIFLPGQDHYGRGPGTGCHSACSTAFLGGRNASTGKPMRIKSSTGLLGFHQFSMKLDPDKKYTKKDYDDMVQGVQDITFAFVEYFKDIDEDLTFLPFMMRAPTEQIPPAVE